MTRRQSFLVAAVVVIAAIIVVLVWPAEPQYRGRSIQKCFYMTGGVAARLDPEADAEAFRAMGPTAVPFLVRRLEAAPSPRWTKLLSYVSTTASEISRQNKEMWQSRAAYLLGEMGPAAKSAETNLVRAAAGGNWSLRGSATIALMKIRREPIAPLIEKLKDTSDWRAWYENAMMVGEFGARAEPAIPILLAALQDTNNVIQAHALIALGMIARQPDKCIPAMVPFLASANISDQQKALGSLLRFGTNALVARKEIQALVNDPDPWTQREARRGTQWLAGLETAWTNGVTAR